MMHHCSALNDLAFSAFKDFTDGSGPVQNRALNNLSAPPSPPPSQKTLNAILNWLWSHYCDKTFSIYGISPSSSFIEHHNNLSDFYCSHAFTHNWRLYVKRFLHTTTFLYTALGSTFQITENLENDITN